jgi:hypothetical protein
MMDATMERAHWPLSSVALAHFSPDTGEIVEAVIRTDGDAATVYRLDGCGRVRVRSATLDPPEWLGPWEDSGLGAIPVELPAELPGELDRHPSPLAPLAQQALAAWSGAPSTKDEEFAR